jgi:ribosomal protein S12 methylthiotransferase accessory factor
VDVKVKLASTDFGIADVYAVGTGADEHNPVMATACGEAAHPDRERAVRKALLEFVAARTRKAFTHGPLEAVRAAAPPGYLERYLESTPLDRAGEEQRALDAMVGWTGWTSPAARPAGGTVLSQRSTGRAGRPPDDAGRRQRGPARRRVRAPARRGMQVLVADFPSADGSVHAVKAVVPGSRWRR